MISRWLARRRDRAALRWHNARRQILQADPAIDHPTYAGRITRDLAIARRRLTRWDAALDLWTSNGTP